MSDQRKRRHKPPPRPSRQEVGKERVIYTPYITLKDGRRLYASAYGLKAFRIVVND